jgi:SAM-dependent MidA family methyltransferase
MSSYHSSTDLPVPDAAQVAHSSRLIERIVERIAQAGGVISFRDYMQACLYEPGLGYYAAGAAKFGAQGDFVTAPEISALFGQCIANYATDLFEQGLERRILEFGAGTGKLCGDIIQRLRDTEQAWDRYLILEPSPDLQQRQQEHLASRLTSDELQRVQWLSGLPSGFRGLVLGNEVLDAMPVNVVVKQGEWVELGVGFDGQRFVWQEFARNGDAINGIGSIDRQAGLADGYCTELNLNYAPWCQALANACDSASLLLIDYGYERPQYYHAARSSGTLMCFYQHRAHPDPLIYPGLQDITAFVDFDAFGDAALAAGFCIDGLTSQADFLMQNGLLELIQQPGDDVERQLALAQQVKTLTLPGEMGEKFQCITLSFECAED